MHYPQDRDHFCVAAEPKTQRLESFRATPGSFLPESESNQNENHLCQNQSRIKVESESFSENQGRIKVESIAMAHALENDSDSRENDSYSGARMILTPPE